MLTSLAPTVCIIFSDFDCLPLHQSGVNMHKSNAVCEHSRITNSFDKRATRASAQTESGISVNKMDANRISCDFYHAVAVMVLRPASMNSISAVTRVNQISVHSVHTYVKILLSDWKLQSNPAVDRTVFQMEFSKSESYLIIQHSALSGVQENWKKIIVVVVYGMHSLEWARFLFYYHYLVHIDVATTCRCTV